MRRLLGISLVLPLLTLAGGCAMCCAPYDGHYLYQGGAWVRHNPESGRVGSLFDEAGAPVTLAPATAPALTPAVPPGTRSVIPRDAGETYLP